MKKAIALGFLLLVGLVSFVSAQTVSTCLNLKNSLKLGSKDTTTNSEVTKLQNFLYPSYLSVVATGYYGNLTTAAVKSFQRDNGIDQVGRVGPITRERIQKLSCGEDASVVASAAPAPKNTIAPPHPQAGTITITSPWEGQRLSNMNTCSGEGCVASMTITTIRWSGQDDEEATIDLYDTNNRKVKTIAVTYGNRYVWLHDPSLSDGEYKIVITTRSGTGSTGYFIIGERTIVTTPPVTPPPVTNPPATTTPPGPSTSTPPITLSPIPVLFHRSDEMQPNPADPTGPYGWNGGGTLANYEAGSGNHDHLNVPQPLTYRGPGTVDIPKVTDGQIISYRIPRMDDRFNVDGYTGGAVRMGQTPSSFGSHIVDMTISRTPGEFSTSTVVNGSYGAGAGPCAISTTFTLTSSLYWSYTDTTPSVQNNYACYTPDLPNNEFWYVNIRYRGINGAPLVCGTIVDGTVVPRPYCGDSVSFNVSGVRGGVPSSVAGSTMPQDKDKNGAVIPSPTRPAGTALCEGLGQDPAPGAGTGPCGSYEIKVADTGYDCSSGMTGANAITRAWQYNLEDYTPSSLRNGNSIRFSLARDNAMVFRFKTGDAGLFTLPKAMNIAYEEHTANGPAAPRFITLSEKRCDFDYSKMYTVGASTVNVNNCFQSQGGGGVLNAYITTTGEETLPQNINKNFPYCQLKPNTYYYVNMRWELPSASGYPSTQKGNISCPAGYNARNQCGTVIGFN